MNIIEMFIKFLKQEMDDIYIVDAHPRHWQPSCSRGSHHYSTGGLLQMGNRIVGRVNGPPKRDILIIKL